MASTEVTDGRIARSLRTRHAVVDALLALIDEGDLRPTGQAIAARAGVSQRSLYMHFDDLEDLFAEASQVRISRVLADMEPIDPTIALEERLGAFAGEAARLLDATLAVRRAASLQEPFSPTLAATLARVRTAARRNLERVFATELDTFEREEREQRLAALVVASSSHTWEVLRLHQQLRPEVAEAVMIEMLAAPLGVER